MGSAIRGLSWLMIHRGAARKPLARNVERVATTTGQVPYATLVNMTRSPLQADNWQIGVVDAGCAPERHEGSVGRGLMFAVPLSGLLWVALYGVYRVLAG